VASDEELERVHDPRFLQRLRSTQNESYRVDGDTYLCADSVHVAELAAGGVVDLVDAVIDGPLAQGIALVRPPGHHASFDRASGFCILNNVAIAAAHARARGLERIAIVDWDVHHGNGTQDAFIEDPSVLYISTHQFPFYPGTGALSEMGQGNGNGYTINIPLEAGGTDGVYRSAFERVILPVLEQYAPELVLVSAGFDASERDPLADMRLSSDAFGWMARALRGVADRSANGRIALVLEGGYDLKALEDGVLASTRGIVCAEAVDIARAPDSEDVARAARHIRDVWAHVT
jgi:acetoin utilization deacetylase AcuC-like enzyme